MLVNLSLISLSELQFDIGRGGCEGGIEVGLFHQKIICFLICKENRLLFYEEHLFYLLLQECFIELYRQREIKM